MIKTNKDGTGETKEIKATQDWGNLGVVIIKAKLPKEVMAYGSSGASE